MASFTGQSFTAPSKSEGTQSCSAEPRFVAYPGSAINPLPSYLIAQWDSTPARRFWASFTPDATSRPTSGGGITLPFVGSPVIQGRIS